MERYCHQRHLRTVSTDIPIRRLLPSSELLPHQSKIGVNMAFSRLVNKLRLVMIALMPSVRSSVDTSFGRLESMGLICHLVSRQSQSTLTFWLVRHLSGHVTTLFGGKTKEPRWASPRTWSVRARQLDLRLFFCCQCLREASQPPNLPTRHSRHLRWMG